MKKSSDLFISNELSEKEINNTIPNTSLQKQKKQLTKEIKDLYTEYYKTLMKRNE